MKTIWLVIFCMILSVTFVSAQNKDSKPQIKIISRAYKDSVCLRWAPDDPSAWKLLNEYGYTLLRSTLLKDGNLLDKPEEKVLSIDTLKPAPLNKWEPFAEEKDQVAIAAQAIYGESFEVSSGLGKNQMVEVIKKSRETESRFSYALYAADLSPKTAELSGLMYTDKNVNKNEKYLYTIVSNVPDSIMKIDSGYVYTGPGEHKPLPEPRNVKARFSDHSVMISWNIDYLTNTYIGYQIERSNDGGNAFHPINDVPVTNTGEQKNVFRKRMFKTDSLPKNNKEYQYRVRGITSFGETGPPSDTVKGKAYKRLSARPEVTRSDFIREGAVNLEWSFPDSLNNKIKGFQIQRSGSDNEAFDTINSELLSSDTRTYLDTVPEAVNYYKIAVKDKHGHKYETYPYMVQKIDSVPPAPPEKLRGAADTSGVLTLRWKSNTEKDLFGYRIYSANFANADFYQVTSEAVSENVFHDTLNLKTLTSSVYYKITAIDRHYNESDFSKVVKIARPDTIPPVAPVFNNYRSAEKGIHIEWTNSSSNDVHQHLLYRRTPENEKWKLISKFLQEDSLNTYLDSTVAPGHAYRYTMVAVDQNQQESKPAKPITVESMNKTIRNPFSDLSHEIDREKGFIRLKWEPRYSKIKNFQIYKKQKDSSFRLIKSIDGIEEAFTDRSVTVNSNYSYRIRAVFENGIRSAFSKTLKIKF